MDASRNYFFILLLASFSLLLGGCGNNNSHYKEESSWEPSEDVSSSVEMGEAVDKVSMDKSVRFIPPILQNENDAEEFVTSKAASYENDGNKKFIRTAQLQFSVENIVSATHRIEDIIILRKGFVIKSTLSNNRNWTNEIKVSADSVLEQTTYNASGNLVLRVPYTELDIALREIASVATVVSYRDVSANDITFDLIAKKLLQERKAAKAKRMKSVAGAGKVHKLEDLISAEEAIDRARESADLEMVSELIQLDNVEYSTITVSLTQAPVVVSTMKKTEKLPESYEPSIFEEALDALKSGWNGLLSFMIGLLNVWPLWIVIGVGIYGVIRWRRKKNS